MGPLITLVLAFVFGALDQYAGSLPGHFGHFAWATDVSLISAPWLLLAFLAGWCRRQPRDAAVVGFGATVAALLGYMTMTLSPIENAHPTVAGVLGFVRSDPYMFLGAVVTGPLFGWLGHRWRVARAWQGAVVASAVVCAEPLAHIAIGRAITSTTVALAEVAAGGILAAYFAVIWLRTHRLA